MTIHDMDDGFGNDGVCREYTLPRSDENYTPKGWIRGETKIGPVLEVKVTHHLYQDGMEIRVRSLKNDGSQSWVVICRGMNEYVDELNEENGKSHHYEELVTCMEKPVATLH